MRHAYFASKKGCEVERSITFDATGQYARTQSTALKEDLQVRKAYQYAGELSDQILVFSCDAVVIYHEDELQDTGLDWRKATVMPTGYRARWMTVRILCFLSSEILE